MKHLLHITVGISLVLLCSCSSSRDVERMLDKAEELMVERPDSSLVLLEGIDITTVASRGTKARYALLLTQAKDKNYIDETDATLIDDAVEYYEESDNVHYKFMSYYYQGRILSNKGDYTHAIIAYTQAEELLDKLNDNYLAGLLYTEIGNIYSLFYDYNKWLTAAKQAYSHYSQTDLQYHKAYALHNIGHAYINLEDKHEAIKYTNEALKYAIALGDIGLETGCYENLIILYDMVGDYEHCGDIINITQKNINQPTSSGYLSAVANYYAASNNHRQAEEYLRRAWEQTTNANDTVCMYFQSASTYNKMGRTDEAYSYLTAGINKQRIQLHDILQQPIESVQKEYFHNQAKFNAYRLKKNTQIYVSLFVVALLCIVIIIMYARHRVISKDLEISKYMDLATELQHSIQDKERHISEISKHISKQEEAHTSMIREMHSQVADLFHKQYKLLDKLSNTYYETHGISREKESIYEQVRIEINKFANDKGTLAQLEKIVNQYKRNAINLVRTEIPSISPRDIKLLCYIYAGFSAKSISIFVGETTGNILTRKYRLRNKISKLNTPNAQIILEEMP
ncbi:MAG: hypothetical protein IKC12_02715 [Alistipes sp.]|nr:hypothetical protein [Alistipes sp.]